MNTSYVKSSDGRSLANAFRMAQQTERQLDSHPVKQPSNSLLSRFAWGCGMAFMLTVGTGGTASAGFINSRDMGKYPSKEIKQIFAPEKSSFSPPQAAPRSAAEALSYIRSSLKPAVTELAAIFGVSRQAIYNWQAGERISEGNEMLLGELASAADTIMAHPLAGKINAKRKLPGGKTLLETIKMGAPGRDAALALISLAEKEGHQRAAVDAKLSNRKRIGFDNDAVGIPHMVEKV